MSNHRTLTVIGVLAQVLSICVLLRISAARSLNLRAWRLPQRLRRRTQVKSQR